MNLKKVDIKPFYGGLSDNLINSFYKPCLENSELYRRSTAYFTGGVYALAASSYKDFFIQNKGYIELVTSPFFDKNVHDAFKDYDQFKNDTIVVESLIENSLERLEETKGGKDLIELISILLGLNS